ncbi:hypothetical protein [Lactococcus lactis]|uniref:hypothetical protein n=1 Tax=Lactococcus lactis TaxID=1358 RepID=UPI00117A649A|nr:hypothetical protein [Lactococcus lactis]TRW67415.1 hypothetical protein FNJ58_12665 [Lactococcus lactis]
MLKLKNQDRGSGKTTKIIELMKDDELALCLVPYYGIKRSLFPKELQKRIISARSFKNVYDELQGRRYNKIYIDELLYSNFFIAELFYNFGRRSDISIIVYGTDNS